MLALLMIYVNAHANSVIVYHPGVPVLGSLPAVAMESPSLWFALSHTVSCWDLFDKGRSSCGHRSRLENACSSALVSRDMMAFGR